MPPRRSAKWTRTNFPSARRSAKSSATTRAILKFRKGEIIVRQGDYGTSAFLILRGAARVVLKPDLPPALLGRQATNKKGIFRTLAQIWNGSRPAESLSRRQLGQDAGLGARQDADQVHVFLQDVPRILDKHRTEQMTAGEFFGEIAALSRMARTSTIFADSDDAELLEIRWQGLRDLMKYDDCAARAHQQDLPRTRAGLVSPRDADFPASRQGAA